MVTRSAAIVYDVRTCTYVTAETALFACVDLRVHQVHAIVVTAAAVGSSHTGAPRSCCVCRACLGIEAYQVYVINKSELMTFYLETPHGS